MTTLANGTTGTDATSFTDKVRDKIDLIVTPAFFVVMASAVGAMWVYSDFDSTVERILSTERLVDNVIAHVSMTLWSTVFVVGLAVPLGIFLTRPAYRRFAPPILAFANSGQAIPAFGLLVLFAGAFGTGQRTAIYAFTVFALLPVLRNTMVGLQQVDQSVIDAGRGMGLSKRQALFRIELPLSVPVILAGIRTALVINVGMATLGFLISAGGLGEPIGAGLQLRRDEAVFIAGGMVAALALLVDFVAALAVRYLRPKGL
ncbi:MAG: ABC transporter permease [Acidimicrobiia bacterium]